jgi:hypothetical protein
VICLAKVAITTDEIKDAILNVKEDFFNENVIEILKKCEMPSIKDFSQGREVSIVRLLTWSCIDVVA